VISPKEESYNELGAAWWQYVAAQPSPTNPLGDATGANCAKGQSGSVFFLTGTSGTGRATRDACTVFGEKELFFPLVNVFDVHTPGDGLDTPTKVYKDLQTVKFRADTLYASVDGVPVANLNPATTPYRSCSEPVAGCEPSSFSVRFPADNIFNTDKVKYPAGKYGPAVQEGYYLMLSPLKPGRHTITFGGTGNFAGPFSQDVTYHLLVVEKK
jgi:hypothetical protein